MELEICFSETTFTTIVILGVVCQRSPKKKHINIGKIGNDQQVSKFLTRMLLSSAA